MTWLVEVEPDNLQRVSGRLIIENGCLIFTDSAGRITIAFSRRRWLTVCLDEQ